MAFSPETYGAIQKWTKSFIGMTGMKVGTVTNGDSFPTTRPSGNPLVEDDYVQPAASSEFPFSITYGGVPITFSNENDKAFWTGTTWTIQAGLSVETNEVAVKVPAEESYSKNKYYQSEINKEVVQQLKNNIIESNDLDSIAVADIEKRPYFQKVDTTARKAGIYWYNSTSTKTDKWEKMGGSGGIVDGDTLPTTAAANDWFYLKQDQTIGTETYYVGVYRYNGTKWEFQFGTKDITEDFKTKNPTITFDSGTSLLKVGKRFNIATTMTLQTPVTDRQSAERKVATLPDDCTTTGSFYADLTTQGGQQTSEENRQAFYVAGGSHYIDPSSFTTKKVTVSGCADIRTMYNTSNYTDTETKAENAYTHNPTTDKWYYGNDEIQVTIRTEDLPLFWADPYIANTTTHKIYKNTGYKAPQRINESTYELWFNDDGTPDFNHTIVEIDSTKDYQVFRMHLPKTEVGSDYTKVKDETGRTVYKYIPYYQMDLINIKCNTTFLYNYELQKQGCNVDSTGKFCDVTVTPTYESQKFAVSQPFDGTVTWTPKTYLEELKLERVSVHDKGLYVRGNTSIKKITMGGTF